MTAPEISVEDQELITQRKWRKPRFPFVAFRCRKAEILANADRKTDQEIETGMRGYDEIVEYNVGGVHRQVSKLERIIRNKRFKIVTWGNFPAPDSQIGKSTKQSSDDKTDWEVLEAFLVAAVNGQVRESKEIKGLKAKVAELEAKAKNKG